jgi:tetratricopeptide (TPR) repeat protein
LLIEALAIARSINKPETIAQALCHLGYGAVQTGKLQAARRYLQEALVVTRSSNIVWLECEALLHMGDLFLEGGDSTAAREKFTASLEIADSLGMQELKAFSLYGLARSGDVHAIQYAQDSLALLTDLGHIQAEDVCQWLQEIGDG